MPNVYELDVVKTYHLIVVAESLGEAFSKAEAVLIGGKSPSEHKMVIVGKSGLHLKDGTNSIKKLVKESE
ncbi:MAG: hypothetical protein AUG85_05415 [Gemmatimonadetes bacterium 13_1_20CM_4_66_11]|nr:MAG: hypothetical protein AUI86_11895 [Gemmatimonadetes bacterium 13_1_40CM_3_66_12]OLD88140.1 MAG: hypothetical protein AUG85_05415 [Gemmatimonadetes bacterium 13_1_20CM_4_66_11]